ncbi:hypothetical protein [Fusobacterium polymorphum]|uniref:hypothetical protein n=1 Tax=Fusobacterium nucleatum subsp. polymorphum TaxID=76857 RepID=UPI0030D4E5CA
MEYIYGGICGCLVIVICLLIVLQKNKSRMKNQSIKKMKDIKYFPKKDSNDLVIKIEMLPVEAIKDENSLIEITDNRVLARVNNLIPGLIQAGNTANNLILAAQATKNEVLYRAIIPAGTKLANSNTMNGAVRGFINGTKGIQEHANFVAVEVNNGAVPITTNSVVATMGIASIIVGQYYMAQINTELKIISNGISQIQNFQNNEYRSRVLSLVTHIKKIADFQTEILENDELRLSKILQLDSLEEECTQLLGQANLTLMDFTKKSELKYKEYENILGSVQEWFMYQKSLLDILCKISDLRYTLYLGVVSREQCIAILPIYSKYVSDTQKQLTTWHKGVANQLGIDIEKGHRKRSGINGTFHSIIGFIANDDSYNFKSMEKKTIDMIKEQELGHNKNYPIDTSELYNEDVQLIVKNGKIYYLPNIASNNN